MTEGPTRRTRFADWLHRYRWWLLAGWLVHAVLIHALILGITSWDGLAYRIPPIVELVQHGDLGLDKYWAFPFTGFIPFVELAQAPLLALIGLPGLLLTGPLIVFPLCVIAIYKLGTKLTGSSRSGTFAALAYVAIPMINAQPFSGYVDYVVSAALAYVVYALLEARDSGHPWRAGIRIVIATMLVTLAKPTGLYVCGLLTALLLPALFVVREDGRFRVVGRRALGLAITALAIGALPALSIQIVKYLHYGSPIYPFQLDVLGIRIGSGLPAAEMFAQSGLGAPTWQAFGHSFVAAWLWPDGLPSVFYDSRSLGGGWVLVVALCSLPTFVRSATRVERWLGVSCVIVSLIARDFWYPRWSYTLVIAICVVIGRALSTWAGSPLRPWRYWLAFAVLILHLARPAYEIWLVSHPGLGGPRVDVAGISGWFESGPSTIEPMPDLDARFVILEYTRGGFLLPLYGRRLSNEVVYTVHAAVGVRCDALRFLAARDPSVLFVDDLDLTRGCVRTCEVPAPWSSCRAWRLYVAPREPVRPLRPPRGRRTERGAAPLGESTAPGRPAGAPSVDSPGR